MSKLLIALLALDIGVSLSKIYIFTWQSHNFRQKQLIKVFEDRVLVLGIYYFFRVSIYKINN